MEVSEKSNVESALTLEGYQVRDGVFGKPYIDRDEWRETPYPHRNVHGGFS